MFIVMKKYVQQRGSFMWFYRFGRTTKFCGIEALATVHQDLAIQTFLFLVSRGDLLILKRLNNTSLILERSPCIRLMRFALIPDK